MTIFTHLAKSQPWYHLETPSNPPRLKGMPEMTTAQVGFRLFWLMVSMMVE